MLYALAVTVYVIVSLFLIVVVLLQPGQMRGRGGTFGGGSSTGSAFGGRGVSPIMKRITTGAAATFMILSIVLARAGSDSSAVDGTKLPEAAAVGAPAAPEKPDDKAATPVVPVVPVVPAAAPSEPTAVPSVPAAAAAVPAPAAPAAPAATPATP
ncbi:MAG: preprotein translocase subunit SecG [Myxococcales bacterium]|nr:preprotein translocase subunit SecG [Myxococcales bacterium]